MNTEAQNNFKLTCNKCGTQSNTIYCPNCGNKIIVKPKNKEEIEQMIKFIDKALVIDKPNANIASAMTALIALTSLRWAIGQSDTTPIDLILTNAGDKNTPGAKELIELARMGITKKE